LDTGQLPRVLSPAIKPGFNPTKRSEKMDTEEIEAKKEAQIDAIAEKYAKKIVHHALAHQSETKARNEASEALFMLCLFLIGHILARVLGANSGPLTYLDAMLCFFFYWLFSVGFQRWHLWRGKKAITDYSAELNAMKG
jgi:hypothetical protein